MGNYQNQINPESKVSYINVHQSKLHFLIGTNIQEDALTRFDDMDIIRLTGQIKLHSIYFFLYDNQIVGYESIYKDQLNKFIKISRLAQSQKHSKQNEKKENMVLEDQEHIVTINTTFGFENISSIQLITNKQRTFNFGKQINECTSNSQFLQKDQNILNVITAFSGTFDTRKLKELFIYRTQVIVK